MKIFRFVNIDLICSIELYTHTHTNTYTHTDRKRFYVRPIHWCALMRSIDIRLTSKLYCLHFRILFCNNHNNVSTAHSILSKERAMSILSVLRVTLTFYKMIEQIANRQKIENELFGVVFSHSLTHSLTWKCIKSTSQ